MEAHDQDSGDTRDDSISRDQSQVYRPPPTLIQIGHQRQCPSSRVKLHHLVLGSPHWQHDVSGPIDPV